MVSDRLTIRFYSSDKWKEAAFFQIYLTSILHTYKVFRKLQNIYYFQEGIIMWSTDKTICKHRNIAQLLFLSVAPTLLSWIWKDITHLYQEKLRHILYKAPFYRKKPQKQQTSAHETQVNEWQLQYMWAMSRVTLKPPSEMVIKQKRYQYLLWKKNTNNKS